MFCPLCGGVRFEQLFGGRCSERCSTCGMAVDCLKMFEDILDESTRKLTNPVKAMARRRAWKKREKGKRL